MRTAWSVVVRFVSGMTGQGRYAAYVAHERARHPDREPLDERAFWRLVHDEEAASPAGRCC